MKPITLAFLLSLLAMPLFAQRHIHCDSFCVTNVEMDTAMKGIMAITVYNGSSDFVNYPMVQVVVNGDTVAKQTDLYYYGQLGKSSLVHYAKTSMNSVPQNFKCKVVFSSGYNGTCVLDYPCLADDNVGIAKSHAEHQVSIYPNPGEGLFHVSFPGGSGTSYRVTDIYGRQIMQDKITASGFNIDMEGKAPGMYFLQIYSSGGWKAYSLVLK